MSYDFISQFALRGDDEAAIDKVCKGTGEFSPLHEASWTTKAQVLATGINNSENYKKWIKNGRDKNNNQCAIDGHPGLINSTAIGLPVVWQKLLQPSPDCLRFLPRGSLLISLDLTLTRPFHSRDDRPFYPMDNPLKREWIFHVPYLAAAGIKGLLRWAWRMCHKDSEHVLEVLIFGPRSKDCGEDTALQGSIIFWPLFWNGRVGLEVLNPQDKKLCAGMEPVKYEVVKRDAIGRLHLLVVNHDLSGSSDIRLATGLLLGALHYLLEASGLSAKRSADWGSVLVKYWRAWSLAAVNIAPETPQDVTQTAINPWLEFCDNEGQLLPFDTPIVFTSQNIAKLLNKSPKLCKGEHREKALMQVRKRWEERQLEVNIPQPKPAIEAQTVTHQATVYTQWREQLLCAGIVAERS